MPELRSVWHMHVCTYTCVCERVNVYISDSPRDYEANNVPMPLNVAEFTSQVQRAPQLWVAAYTALGLI